MAMQVKTKEIIEIAKEAGKETLKIYNEDFDVEMKKDSSFTEGVSPLTKADKKSNEIINQKLKELHPKIPILSEENKEVPYEERKEWNLFWMIDPLDGTKEFVNKNGDFTINISLIENQKPVFGVVYAPVNGVCYFTKDGKAFRQKDDEEPKEIHGNGKLQIPVRVVASRSHMNEETEKFIENIKEEFGDAETVSVGSSLKLCMVAEGKADIYPRLAPTKEWDTAAAHAIVNAAGKKVFRYDTNEELIYNKENILNPWFVVK